MIPKSNMARWMYACTGISTAAFLVLLLIGHRPLTGWLLSVAITLGTTAYHFWMRLIVGAVIGSLPKHCFACRGYWFRPRPAEQTIFRILKVRRWKDHLPTFDPDQFSLQTHSWDEIAQAMCQAEVVHEVIVVLSFLPLFAARWFGAFEVFLITSILAAGYDLLFVILQRYNRPRVVRVAAHQRSSQQEET